MSKNNKAITNGSSDDEMEIEGGPLQQTVRDLLGPNFDVGNYALVSMLTMIAVMFMFQTDIIAFQQAVNGLQPDQINALTIALGGPININGITDPEQYSQAVTEMYQNFAASMNIQQVNVAGMVDEIVRRNTEMRQLIPAGWTFPSIYGEERFNSVIELGNRILGDATNPVSQLFSTIITSLRTQLGLPTMGDVINSIHNYIDDNISDFVQTNPRLEPAREYYRAVLGIFNGGGNLWEDLQNISTITAFNQYYHIYGGVFIAFMVALRNSVSITGYVAQGIVRAANRTVTFVVGEDLYNDIVRQVEDTTRNVARLPVKGVYYTARFVIHRVNDVVNLVARALTPRSQFELFMGDPQDIPDNLIVSGTSYALLNADSSVDYDTFTEIANFLELYILDNQHFQRVVEIMRNPNLAQRLGTTLEEVLAPEQNMRQSQGDSQDSDTTNASSVSGTYGSNPALMASFLRNILSVFFTASAVAVIENPNVVNPASALIQGLRSDISEGASEETQDGLERIETVIIPNVYTITEQVEQTIERPPVFSENDNMNIVSNENSQDSIFSADEAVGVLSDMQNSDRIGGRKRKIGTKKQKGGKRRKTMKRSKKSKLRKHKTIKRRKNYRHRKTRKM